MIITPSRKQNLACEHLVQRAAHRPNVDPIVVREPQNDLRRPVEPRTEVGSYFVFGNVAGAAEVADFDDVAAFVDEDVVGFDV